MLPLVKYRFISKFVQTKVEGMDPLASTITTVTDGKLS
jgi:hypothetical protein